MKTKTISIPMTPLESISAVLSLPDKIHPQGVVIAHGAANDMNTPLIRTVAQGLAQKGFACLRFNFLYRELNKKSIDPEHRLVRAWQQAAGYMETTLGLDRIIAVGKSLGARIAASATCSGALSPERLIFLGYPLHAPGKKEMLRDRPLYEMERPMLFFEGTRDPFCDLSLLKPVLEKTSAPTDLEIIENGDHSLGLPKSDPRSREEVFQQVIDRCADWIQGS